ncbi:hypothetical protein [Variovorax sp. JS1663]|uniref:hypothetical protein n=1 Tax=Variovorax sp. JS1663 TaxID=1851577 RepID=UPI000B3483F2|nr:hypothetical protein [Variovorax sp. JS1663]OUL98548.1 hypothetical protein A8M77_30980 [Variovorax sp. JS1663]
MNLLFTGRGTSGSWQIRGEQLGRTLSADVRPLALDVAPYDLAILVKRPDTELLERLRRAGTRVIWDVVDAWPQPAGNDWDEKRCRAWLEEMVARIRPAGIVAATEQMAQDCERFRVPVLWLPHHARPGLRMNPIRPLKVVGYEGGEQYLGKWRAVAEAECERRGWKFVINPQELADLDVVLALRDCGGYAPRHWKSNVKLANAQGSGTPVVCNREAGYLETQCGAERWADTPEELTKAFDALESSQERFAASRRLKAAAPSLDSIATRYLEWLRSSF